MNGQIGYTDDGKVFMTILTMIDDKPIQSVVQMEPSRAREVAKVIEQAATDAEEKRIVQ